MLVVRVSVCCWFNAIDRVDICKSFANHNNITENIVQGITYKFRSDTITLENYSIHVWFCDVFTYLRNIAR